MCMDHQRVRQGQPESLLCTEPKSKSKTNSRYFGVFRCLIGTTRGAPHTCNSRGTQTALQQRFKQQRIAYRRIVERQVERSRHTHRLMAALQTSGNAQSSEHQRARRNETQNLVRVCWDQPKSKSISVTSGRPEFTGEPSYLAQPHSSHKKMRLNTSGVH